MQAVRRPASAQPTDRAQARAAGADHHHVVGVVLDRIGAAVHRRRAAVSVSFLAVGRHSQTPDEIFSSD
jgi:hypothetical protein